MKRRTELSIPDVHDGLTSVQRRILFAMYLLKFLPQKMLQKTAKVVGHTMACFHPHGDQEIYDELVRMAQAAFTRYPLLDGGDSNFGNLDEPPAQMRFTKVRLNALAMELLAELKSNPVEYWPTFDFYDLEPMVLPAKLPMMLMNGTDIDSGNASSIPPHNLAEVIDGIIAKINNPKLDSIGLLEHIKGPDFASGCTILDTDQLRQAYLAGSGLITCRGSVEVESDNKLIVTALPPKVGPAAFTKGLTQLKEQGSLRGVTSIENQSEGAAIRILISVDAGLSPTEILQELFAHTDLEKSIAVNLIALTSRGQISSQELGTAKKKQVHCGKLQERHLKIFSLEEIIEEFLLYRVDVVTNCIKFKLEQDISEAHILEGWLVAKENLFEVTQAIISADSKKDAKVQLHERFKLSKTQVDALVKMRLRSFNRKKVANSREDLTELHKEIESNKRILDSREAILNLVRADLEQLKSKYADPRRSQIIPDQSMRNPLVSSEKSSFIIILSTESIEAKRAMIYRLQANFETESPKHVWYYQAFQPERITDGNYHVFLCSSTGRCIKFHERDIPVMNKSQLGLEPIKLEPGESIIGFDVFDSQLDQTILFITNDGFAKRVRVNEFCLQSCGGVTEKAMALSGAESELCCAAIINEQARFRVQTENWIDCVFAAIDIPVQQMKDSGIKLIELCNEEKRTGLVQAGKITYVTISAANGEEAEEEDEDEDEEEDEGGT